MSDKLNKMAESYQKKVSHDCQADNCRTCFDITEAFKAGHSSRDADVIKLQSDLKKAVEALELISKAHPDGNPSRIIELAKSVLKELRGEK